MTSRGRFLAGSLAASASAALTPAGAQTLALQTSVAVLCPLTGPDASSGQALVNGVRGAIDDANFTRLPNDRFYALRTFDDQNTVAFALLSSRFAIDDQTQSVAIGHLSGKVTDAVLQFYANANMPIVVPAASTDSLTAHGYRNVFRLPTKDTTEGILHARVVKRDKRGSKIAVVSFAQADYGPAVASAFARQAQADGLSATPVQIDADSPDYPAAARAALAAQPDLVFIAGLARDLGGIIPALRTAGYRGNFNGSQGCFDAGLAPSYGDAVEGFIVSSSMPPLNQVPAISRIKVDYESRYGGLNPISAFGYAAMQMVVTASRRMGTNSRIVLARAFAQPIAFDTMVGSFTFDPFGDTNDPNVYFYQLTKGNWSYLHAAHPSGYIGR